ncbi:MAG TPA: CBS domain-containing protein [Nocardioides sp.]|jgi:CBS domain-containing protein|nr:CBS domain-containing protein [Nocardioides sp.]
MYARTIPPVTPATVVRKVMVWPVATVDGDATLAEVAEALAADEVGALCVTEDGRLAGIISERDVVVHLAAGADPAHLTAAEAMSNDLVTASPDDSVLDAARRMEEAQVRHLPVIDNGRIAGIVSMRDLFAVLANEVYDPAVVFVRSGTKVMVIDE